MKLNPKKQIDYLIGLTDKIGIIEHCNGNNPNYVEGWCVDDNARALQVCLRYKTKKLKAVKKVYFGFIKSALHEEGLYDDLNQDLTWKKGFEVGAEHYARTLSALGETIKFDFQLSLEAKQIFDQVYLGIKESRKFYPRVMAQTILGLQYYLQEEIGYWANEIVQKYNQEKTKKWQWFEDALSYDNGRMPLALLTAYQQTKKSEYLKIAIESLDFLTKKTFNKKLDCFSFPGNKGWITKSGNEAIFDQQPIEAGAMVEVYSLAYKITKKEKYKDLVIKAMSWYLGKNIKGWSMIDEKSGGIYDGLNEDKVNTNQGAESVLSYLLAAKEIEKLK